MLPRATVAAILLFLSSFPLCAAPPPCDAELERGFTGAVRPFLQQYCIDCHGGDKPEAQFDMGKYTSVAAVIEDQARWPTLLEKLSTKKMPPKDAGEFPTPEARQQAIDWIRAVRTAEMQRHAGDP